MSSGSPSNTRGCLATVSCATGGTRTGGPSNTRRSGAATIRSTMLRSSSCPALPTIIQPSPARNRRPCSVRKNRSASAPSRISRYSCNPFEAGSLSPVSVRYNPALVEARTRRCVACSSGNTEATAASKPPRDLIRSLTSAGMPFVSKSSRTKADCPGSYVKLSAVRATICGALLSLILRFVSTRIASGSPGRRRPKVSA